MNNELTRDEIENGGVTELCDCGTEFMVTLKGVRSCGFCSKECERRADIRSEESTGCTCYSFGRHSCPFHGEP